MNDVHACLAPQDLHFTPAVERHGCVQTSPCHADPSAGMPSPGMCLSILMPSTTGKPPTHSFADRLAMTPTVQFPHSHIVCDGRT